MLFELALDDCSKGAWAAAENNLRLALQYDPTNEHVGAVLREVVASRDAERRSNGFLIS